MESKQYNLTPRELLEWVKKNRDLKATESVTPIAGYKLTDIKVAQKFKEDDIFLNNDAISKNIRRGNAIASINLEGSSTAIYKYARKGIIKFFDYLADFSKNQKITKKILTPINEVFKSGNKVKIYLTEKANGENVQIAYEELKDAWIIGSKNVTCIIRNREDIEWYKTQTKPADRYSYVIEFAELWMDILEKRIIANDLLTEFVSDITGYTLCGENVGDMGHQHIKLYDSKDIVFFGMVNNQTDSVCEPNSKVKALLSKYGLSVVNHTESPVIQSFEEFEKYMKEVYNQILHLNVEKGGEGSVAYFVEVNSEDGTERAVTLGKLKTFEYRFLRKIREKIKGAKKKGYININNII
jgi:hypothetical protein